MLKSDADDGGQDLEVPTDETLHAMADAAADSGDIAMAMRCWHALEDPLARRDVAIIILERQGQE